MSWRTTLAAFAVWALLFGMTGLSVGYGVMTAISSAFTTIVLVMTMVVTADASRWAAVWVLFIPYGLIGTVNIDLEGIFFDIFPLTAGLRLLSVGLLSAFASAALLVYLSGRCAAGAEHTFPRLHTGWPLRLFIVAFAYVILAHWSFRTSVIFTRIA